MVSRGYFSKNIKNVVNMCINLPNRKLQGSQFSMRVRGKHVLTVPSVPVNLIHFSLYFYLNQSRQVSTKTLSFIRSDKYLVYFSRESFFSNVFFFIVQSDPFRFFTVKRSNSSHF